MTPQGFSSEIPSLCLVWDASRLAAYMRDPLAFYWGSVQGWRAPGYKSALVWGTCYHEGVGHFEKLVFKGWPREAALAETIRLLVPAAIKEGMPVQGLKGDAAKRSVRSLIRALVWFEEETRENPLPPIALHDDEPAVEFNFVLPLGMKAPTGEDYLLAGNIDKIAIDEDGNRFAVERKTTTQTLGPYFFAKYDPSMQTYLYDLVCGALFPTSRLRGVTVEACQTAVDFARFDRHAIFRTPNQRAHWEQVIKYWIRRAEQDAVSDTWKHAMNTEVSTFDSAFKQVQRRDPAVWDTLLDCDMHREPVWNPQQKRPPLLGEPRAFA